MIICRVCLDISDELISLKSDRVDALSILHMLKQFTIVNAEQHLPKYICEKCTNNLDIAYGFKRKYEDSIVAFMRQSSSQGEPSKTDGNTNWKKYSQLEFAGEQQEMMRINQLDSTVDLSVEEEIDVEETDVKVLIKMECPTPPLIVEGQLNDDTGNNQTQGEPICNSQTELHSIHSNTNNETVRGVLDEQDTSEGEWHNNIALDVNLPVMETNNTPIWIPIEIPLKAVENSDRFNNLKENDEPINNQHSAEETMHLANGIQNQDHTLTNVLKAKTVFDMNLECIHPERSSRVLRSGPHGIDSEEVSLSAVILNKIYMRHYGHGMKPYRCDVCFRHFKAKGHIKAHRIRHIEGERRIKCTKCRLTFLTRPHFKNHRCDH